MHDPNHVVFSIRRLPLRFPRRPTGYKPLWGFAFWSIRDRTMSDRNGDEIRTPLRRRLYFHPAFFRLGRRWEWYLPSVITVWHRDPESDGSDHSCSNRARARRQAALKQHRYLAAAFWDWWWRRYDLFHWQHWHVQLDFAQQLRRWALTRCETCGGRHRRGRPVNFHVVVDREAEERMRGNRRDGDRLSFRQRWLTGERNLHHHDCADLASLRATKASLPDWVRAYGNSESTMAMQREREPYYGCYAWWRELILGEDTLTAAALAAAHVQRSAHPHTACGGTGVIPVGQGLVGEGGPCPGCDGTGHERVENPIPAELV